MKLEKHIFDKREILLFIIIMVLTSVTDIWSLIVNLIGSCADCGISFGFPLPFYSYGGGLTPMGKPPQTWIFIPFLLINMAIWFVVSYFVIRFYDRVKKK
ncbi:MAG: hypothetical protein V1678_03785 [Candidatus Aenigmatarchaeota archaeon]